MSFIEKVQTLERVDNLIRLKATGTPEDLSYKLRLSRSTIYELIYCLKILGGDIKYSNAKRTFYYNNGLQFKIGFF